MKNILSFRIEQDQIDRLRAIEARDGINVGEQLRRAVAAYLAEGPATRMVNRILHGRPGPREFKKGGAR